jgi:hypothetical protein
VLTSRGLTSRRGAPSSTIRSCSASVLREPRELEQPTGPESKSMGACLSTRDTCPTGGARDVAVLGARPVLVSPGNSEPVVSDRDASEKLAICDRVRSDKVIISIGRVGQWPAEIVAGVQGRRERL